MKGISCHIVTVGDMTLRPTSDVTLAVLIDQ